MSKEQRIEAATLRAKYARVFGVPVALVCVDYLEDGEVVVHHCRDHRLPTWSLGKSTSPTKGEP